MPHAEFAPVARMGVQHYPPEQVAPEWNAGDFLLTHGDAWTSRLIRFGQRLRIHGTDRRYTYWNHTALVTSDTGELVEALGSGVCRSRADKYAPRDYAVVHIEASEPDRAEAVAFAQWVADNHATYGFVTIASLALTLLTGSKFTFFVDGSFICSGLVARAMERTAAIFSRDPVHIMPADLAKYYAVNARN